MRSARRVGQAPLLKTEAGKARIAAAQRKRWARYRQEQLSTSYRAEGE
jgi:hypothetical protein